MDKLLENIDSTTEAQGLLYKYVQVLVDIPNLDTRTFSYIIPDDLKTEIKIGQAVIVPFGRQGGINAFVVGFTNYMPEGIKAKAIYEILEQEPLFLLEYLQFLEWVAEYYCCNLQTVIDAAIPMNFVSKSKKIVSLIEDNFTLDSSLNKDQQKILFALREKNNLVQSRLQKKIKISGSKFYSALRKLQSLGLLEVKNIIEEKNQKTKIEKYVKFLTTDNATKRQQEILDTLNNHKEIKQSEFLELAKTTLPTIKKLAQNKNLEIIEKEVYRNPLKIFENEISDEFPELTQEQQIAADKIGDCIAKQDSEPILLYGVTGSGKTEVYFNAIQRTIETGKNVIFLAPEIPIASQLAKRLSKRFGVNNVAIWHSSVSEGEKFDVWQRLKENKIKIIAGARSAVFAPIKNLGLIVIDEEHESSYKQTSPTPRYDARTLARKRAKHEKAALVLGSATPDINTYYEALNRNKILKLQNRFGKSDIAKVSVIDMKEEFKNANRSIFSRILKSAVHKNLEDEKQTILLVNRRGFSTSTYCQSCGHTVECEKCAIPLILHKTSGNLRCHYCSYERDMISLCPSCGSDAIRYQGMGTQKVEEYARKEFPNARISRIDSDIMSKKNAHIELLNKFSNGEIDILIGTQMIAKGLDNPNVTLVGVLMADQSFSLPDFRASERGFQLLTQVAGRAGRGDFEGRVYFQTYAPGFFALKDAKKQDYSAFYTQEIKNRYELAYPPYSKIIRLIVSSLNRYRAEKFALEVVTRLDSIIENKGIQEKLEVLGPAECVISKIKNEHRFQIVVKNRLEEQGHFLITNFIKKVNIPQDIKFLTDVDPSDML